jgi:16S rRNA (guanine527-N7)-methyltransferase
LKNGTSALFPKGQTAAAELTEASKYWKVQADLVTSRTDPKSHIVVVRELEPKLRTGPGR